LSLYEDAKWVEEASATYKQGRFYQGGMARVAVYTNTLSPARITAHYNAGFSGFPAVSAQSIGSAVKLQWSTGILQSSLVASGPWTNVTGAASPYPAVTTDFSSFFRFVR
jgi:hypothetical protein